MGVIFRGDKLGDRRKKKGKLLKIKGKKKNDDVEMCK